MKLKSLVAKCGSSMVALALTVMATQFASRGCFYILYQPEEPKGLKKFSKNK